MAQVVTRLLREVGSTDAHRNVVHQLMLLVPKTRWSYSTNLQVVLQNVRRQRVHHVIVTGCHNKKLLTLSDDWFQHVLNLQDVANLNVGNQNQHVLKHTLVTLLVVDEQRAQIPPVKFQPLGRLSIRLSSLTTLNGHNTLTAHSFVHLSNNTPRLTVIVRRDGRDVY